MERAFYLQVEKDLSDIHMTLRRHQRQAERLGDDERARHLEGALLRLGMAIEETVHQVALAPVPVLPRT